MSLVSDCITDIRIEVNDSDKTRFPDDTKILQLLKQAVRRANRICQRSQIRFAKKSAVIPTVASQNYVELPADMDVPIGLWRTDTKAPIPLKSEPEWEQIIVASTLANGFLDLQNAQILLNAAPTTVINLKLWYFPTIDPSAYVAGTTMPWEGKLDDIIARYVALRIQNIEEQNTQADQAILQDMEASIVSVYAPQNPTIIARDGWL